MTAQTCRLETMTHQELLQKFDELSTAECPLKWKTAQIPNSVKNDWDDKNKTTTDGKKSRHWAYWYKEEEYRYFQYSYREGEVVLENRDWIRLLGMAFVFAQQAERVAMF